MDILMSLIGQLPSYPPNNPSTNTMPDSSPAMASLCAAYADFCIDLRDPNYGGDGTNRALSSTKS